MRFTVRSALLAGFAVVICLFGVATVVTVLSVRRIALLENRLAQLEHAKHQGHLTVAAVQEQYIHQAHTLISNDDSHVAHYRRIRRKTASQLDALEAACHVVGTVKGVSAIRETVREMDRYFSEDVLPDLQGRALRQNPQHHIKLEQLTEQARVQANHLSGLLTHESRMAQEELNQLLMRTRASTIVILSCAIVTAMLVGLILVRMIAKPVAKLHKVFGQVANGHLDARIVPQGPRELRELACGFNEMARTLEEGRQRLAQQERMAVMGELAAGVAHELNNPLAVITGYLKVLRHDIPEGQSAKDLAIMDDEVGQCRKIVQDLLALARPQAAFHLQPHDIVALVQETADRLKMTDAACRAEIVFSAKPGPVMARVDKTAIKQVVTNLLNNALDAVDRAGTVTVSVEEGKEDTVAIVVSDSGDGIAAEIREDLFKPFRTTKAKGTGIGLAICDVIVKGHGGKIVVGRGMHGGALFKVMIPGGAHPHREDAEKP